MFEMKDLRVLFTKDEIDWCYSEGRKMEEDLLLLNLMSSRLKSCMFDFKAIPTKESSIHQKFLTDLFLKTYKFEGFKYVATYKAVVKCFEELDKENYDESLILDICKGLYRNYGILLSDYVTSFVGCSRGCSRVHGILYKITSEIKES